MTCCGNVQKHIVSVFSELVNNIETAKKVLRKGIIVGKLTCCKSVFPNSTRKLAAEF